MKHKQLVLFLALGLAAWIGLWMKSSVQDVSQITVDDITLTSAKNQSRAPAEAAPSQGLSNRRSDSAPKGAARANASLPFDPLDSQSVMARVSELIDDVYTKIGFSESSPIENPRIATGSKSAQVFYTQSKNGLPVEPFGKVTIDLDSSGDIVKVDSSYMSGLKIINTKRLTPDRARENVPAKSGKKITEGRLIVWAQDQDSGRYAYEYYSDSVQFIVDADSGEVLYRKDKKTYESFASSK